MPLLVVMLNAGSLLSNWGRGGWELWGWSCSWGVEAESLKKEREKLRAREGERISKRDR